MELNIPGSRTEADTFQLEYRVTYTDQRPSFSAEGDRAGNTGHSLELEATIPHVEDRMRGTTP